MAEELKSCSNCGGKCDPTGWMRGDGRQGPECEGCGITTPDVESWNRLMGDQLPSQGGEAVAEYQQLSRYNNWDRIDKEAFDLGKLGSCPERFRALYTHPADQVADDCKVVPVELLRDLLDEGPRAATWAAQDKLRALLAKP